MPQKNNIDQDPRKIPVEDLHLSEDTTNSLKSAGVNTVADVLAIIGKIEADTRHSLINFTANLDQLRQKMNEKGLYFEAEYNLIENHIVIEDDSFDNDIAIERLTDAIDDLDFRFSELEQTANDPKTLEDIAEVKDATANLSTQFYEYMKKNQEIFTYAIEAKSIPRLEQRLSNLEETFDRKRNWGVTILLIALTIFFGIAACISTITALWALFFK